jgi:hypothetical protein
MASLVLSKSDFAGDGTRLQSFRHGEAPEEERESWGDIRPCHDSIPADSQIRELPTVLSMNRQISISRLETRDWEGYLSRWVQTPCVFPLPNHSSHDALSFAILE